MGSLLKPNVESREVRSQATPLAEDVLAQLRAEIAGGTFGAGVGPAQQGAISSAQGFIKARESPEQFLQLMGPLREMFNIQTEKDVAQTREGFGAAGGRLSKGLAREEGRVRNERGIAGDAAISQLFLQDQDRLLQGINLLGSLGAQSLLPFLQLGGMGINPEAQIVNDSPLMSILKLAVPIATAAVGNPLAGATAATGAAGAS